ncbi:MAG: glycosyltransferase family 4 protein [bacterium]
MSEVLRVLALDGARELGGAQVALLTAARALVAREFAFRLAGPAGGAFEAAARRQALAFEPCALGRVSATRPFESRRVLASLRRRLEVDPPDVVLVNGVRSLKACLALGASGPPVVAFVHDVLEPGVASRAMRFFRFFRERVALYLVPAEAARTSWIAHGIPASRVRVVPPAAPAVEPLERDARAVLRRWIGVEPRARVVGFVGQVEPRKGVDVLLDALARAPLPADVVCVVVGDDPFGEHRRYRDAVFARARRTARVRLVGWRRDADRLSAAVDLLVCPSRRDACPLAVLAAMSAGVAVIGASVGGIPEQLDEGRGVC